MNFTSKIKLKTYEDRSLLKRIIARLRIITFEKRALPNFLIIGTQKGGTTSLYRYLATHPKIKPNYVVKELSFFDEYFQRGLPWYKSHFPIKKDGNLYFEGTTHYLFNPNAPKRVWGVLPNITIIVLLRDPVYRAFSSYQHQVRAGREKLSFDEAIKNEKIRLAGEEEKIINDKDYFSFNFQHFSYMSRGIYHKQISNWFNFFPRDQFLFMKSEDFYKNTQENLEKICNFLEVNPIEFNVKRKFNSVRYDENISKDTLSYLRNYFHKPNIKLSKMIGEDFNWN